MCVKMTHSILGMTTFVFPQFRSEAWIRTLIDSQYAHPGVLRDVDLTPQYMANCAAAALYKSKSAATIEQIRRALFRHALFKIQNAEVTTASCSKDRILESIEKVPNPQWTHSLLDKLVLEENTKFIAEEVWKVDRCGSPREYFVRYYREGEDGFSTRVLPGRFFDRLGLLRYYFS